MPANPATSPARTPTSSRALPTLELVWQQDASALVFTRGADGALSAGDLQIGMPAIAELDPLGPGFAARRVEAKELVALAATQPDGLAPGGSAQALFAVVELAQRSVTEGLVHPSLDGGGGRWSAFWGATLDTSVQTALERIAAALPPVSALAFAGDRDATLHDLYPVLVDQIARDRLQARRVRLSSRWRAGRPTAVELFLDGLTAPEPELPRHAGYGALERQLTRWVDRGLRRPSSAAWRLSLHLDERPAPAGSPEPALVLELWLQAEDDPTLGLPASLLWEGGEDVFSFLRTRDARRDLIRQLAELEPLLAAHGVELDASEPSEAVLEPDSVRSFLREALPALEERGVHVLLPAAWLRGPSRVRVNLAATSQRPLGHSSGLLAPAALASFDWRLAVGDVELTEEELAELVSAKERFVRIGGRWQALSESEVERALRFLERRRSGAATAGAGIVELVRAVSGVETDEAGLELGEVTLDARLAELLGDDERRFRPLATPTAMQLDLFPFQERGHGWLRLLGDLGVGGILADDMGLGKTVQAIAMLLSEREDAVPEVLGPTLVVCPMSVARQWVAELVRFAPSLRVHLHHGLGRLSGAALATAARGADVVVTSYDIAARDVDALATVAWDRLLLDEAQDVKNPATKRARALRRLPARRRLALTGTPIENRLG